MILPHTYGATLLLMIVSMICWGSWANTYKMAGKWRFELYYFDFALGLLVAALVYAYTVGTLGYDGFNFLDDLLHAGKRQWAYGFGAGLIFNFANMLLLAAISIAGMAVAFPLAIGLALIVGVVLNSIISPAGGALYLFTGCLLILGAMFAVTMAYRGLAATRQEEAFRAGTAKKARRPAPMKGIVLALTAGFLMGMFFPMVEKAKATELGLGPYAVCVVFAVGAFFSTFVFNMFFMNLPVEGDPIGVFDFFRSKPHQHFLGLLGGIMWCTGAVATFVAASAGSELATSQARVGPALSYAMGQGSTLIAALWGLLVWREFKGANGKTKLYAFAMLVLFAGGLALVSLASLPAAKS